LPDLREAIAGGHDKVRRRAERAADVLAMHAVRFRHFSRSTIRVRSCCRFIFLGLALVRALELHFKHGSQG
jgi:hypothetical protein